MSHLRVMVTTLSAITDGPADPLREMPWQGAGVGFATSTRRRPLRVVAAVVEVLTAMVLVGFAWWCWHRGVTIMMRRGVALSRVEGSWWAAATGAATLAGILLLDAAREAALARGGDRLG